MLNFCVTWNMNSKHCHVAQFVINTLLKDYTAEELLKLPNIKSHLEALIPYTGRLKPQDMLHFVLETCFQIYVYMYCNLHDYFNNVSTSMIRFIFPIRYKILKILESRVVTVRK